MSISFRSRAWGLEWSPSLKYYNVLKQESRFTLELNAAKIRVISKKASNKSCWALKFRTKELVVDYICLPQEWSLAAPKIHMFKIL